MERVSLRIRRCTSAFGFVPSKRNGTVVGQSEGVEGYPEGIAGNRESVFREREAVFRHFDLSRRGHRCL